MVRVIHERDFLHECCVYPRIDDERDNSRTFIDGGGDEELLVSLADPMGSFKQIMDMALGEEMNPLCQRYDGFYRLTKLLERLAEGITHGSISVPE